MTTCCVVGGGPAGMVLGLLLARCGVPTTVLEKHTDFLRDFRGDTVHSSTLTLLDELGLGAAFAALPARYLTSIDVALDSGVYPMADLSRLRGPHRHLALVPQWDLLDLLAGAARAEPTFTLELGAEVTGLVHDGARVSGVRYRRGDRVSTLDADLVIACDGRTSTVREQAGLPYHRFGVPMDVLWFRLPRHDGDPVGGYGRFARRSLIVLIDRGDYFQIGFAIKKGSHTRLEEQGIAAFRDRLVAALPWLADRVGALHSFDDLRLLSVELGRLRRWAAAGVLCIGDAAHAMSPVGGVGINLAVQDAVAAARILAPVLRRGRPGLADLRRVQRRRWWPTVATQTAQQVAHRLIIARAVDDRPVDRSAGGGRAGDASRPARTPLPLALAQRLPVLQRALAHYVSVGVRPEAPPAAARRPATT